jgi:hypothetical protein
MLVTLEAMRTLASAALWATSISVAAACSGKVDDASTPPPTTGQPLAYFYGNPVDGGVIYGVPAGGGAPVKLLMGDSTHDIGSVVTFDARNIYYSSEDIVAPANGQPFSYSLHSIPITGGPSTTLSSLLDGISGIAIDAINVYFSVQTADTFDDAGVAAPHGAIHTVPIGGGAQRVLATLAASPGGVAVDSTYVYWTAGAAAGARSGSAASGSVLKTPIAGGTTLTIASGQLNPRQIAVDATGVYWIDYGTVGVDCTSSDGALWELVTGSSVPTTLASSLHGPGSLALKGPDVYWGETGFFCNTEKTAGGSVSKRAGATGATSAVASAIFDPDNLHVGGSLLYFTQVTDTTNDVFTPTVSKL